MVYIMKKYEESIMKDNHLTERQEKILNSYFDNECGFFGRFMAERLLSKNSSASQYFLNLSSTSNELKKSYNDVNIAKVDLWEGISEGIRREERKAKFAEEEEDESPIAVWLSRLGWGVSGALVTASIGLFMIGGLSPSTNKSGIQLKTGSFSGEVPVQSVTFNNEKEARLKGSQSPMEIDWLRSDGRLRFIQTPNQRSTILWVNKKTRSETSRIPVAKFTVATQAVR